MLESLRTDKKIVWAYVQALLWESEGFLCCCFRICLFPVSLCWAYRARFWEQRQGPLWGDTRVCPVSDRASSSWILPWGATVEHWSIHTATCGGLTLEKVNIPWWKLHPSTAHAGAGSWQSCGCEKELTQEQAVWQNPWPFGNPHWSSLFLMDCTLRKCLCWILAVLEELKPCGKHPHWGSLQTTGSHGGCPLMECRKSVRRKE